MSQKRLTFFLLVATWFMTNQVAAVEIESHAFMSDIYKCLKCHEKVPLRDQDDFTSIVLNKDIVTLCEECHRDKISPEKHPVDVKPEQQVPAGLHLDNYFSMTCVTCHDPHGKPFGDYAYVPYTLLEKLRRFIKGEKRHKTYYLRKPNIQGSLCFSCHTRESFLSEGGEVLIPADDLYVGSDRCGECHREIYDAWEMSVHARYVGDARSDPSLVKAVFDGDKPFPPKDIIYTLGEHWTQRYVVAGKKEPMVRPDIWSIQSSQWVSTGTYNRPWIRYCAGCHTTGFNPFQGTFVETGIGCEACHGPGKTHSETTDQYDIVNPDLLTKERRDMICESCHTSGHDRSGHFRFSVGYTPGDDLMKYFKGLVPKPGQDVNTYKGDGTYEDRHRQYIYWMSNYNITQGILCDVCKNFRQTLEGGSGDIYLSSSEFCATCHTQKWKNYQEHSGHTSDQADCIACHTPIIARDETKYSIHDHKFQFGTPIYSKNLSLKERCFQCHDDPKESSLVRK